MTTDFYQQVYTLVAVIPHGKVLNYGMVALLLGRPRNARAVGYALNNLPYDHNIPWQRVVGKNGRYGRSTIRSLMHGRDQQIALLKDEGIEFNDNQEFILADYLWNPSAEEVSAILNGSSS